MRPLSQRIVDRLIAWHVPLLIVGIVAVAVALVPAGGLQFDRSIENMFAPDDPLLGPYARLKRAFGGNEIVLAVYVDEELLHPDGRGIERLAKVSQRLDSVPGVRDVVSLDQPLGPLVVDDQSRLARPVRKLFEGYTHSADGKIASVVFLAGCNMRCPYCHACHLVMGQPALERSN